MAPPSGPDVLGVFVKAPVAGRVKTRLARDVGARRAARLYRVMGREIVAACVRPGSYRTLVWFAPSAARQTVRAWLKDLRVSGFEAQGEGGLGMRLSAAFRRHFREGARRVVVVGSDCPAVGHRLLSRAFRALDDCDLVIGPSRDGGFYLLGLRAPHPTLFRGIPWSTETVLDRTLGNARRLGLDTRVLEMLRDVDTGEDARALDML